MATAARHLPLSPQPPPGGWTVEAIFDLPEDGQRYELIDGELLVTPPPIWHHQSVLSHLLHLLWPPDDRPMVRTLAAPLGWRPAGRERWLEPDLSVIDTTPLARDDRWVVQPPLLVVEVASRSTRRRDRTVKRRVYDEDGVGAYWMVEPDQAAPSVTVLERAEPGGPLVEVATVHGSDAVELTHPWTLRLVPADLVR